MIPCDWLRSSPRSAQQMLSKLGEEWFVYTYSLRFSPLSFDCLARVYYYARPYNIFYASWNDGKWNFFWNSRSQQHIIIFELYACSHIRFDRSSRDQIHYIIAGIALCTVFIFICEHTRDQQQWRCDESINKVSVTKDNVVLRTIH